jgi:hypothetical protein
MAFTPDQAQAITRLKETEASIATAVMLANESYRIRCGLFGN